jgi:hypothetical protein
MIVDGLDTKGTTGELGAENRRQIGPTEGGLANATVVDRVVSLQQPSVLHKCSAKGSYPYAPAALSEVATRSMSQGDMSGNPCGMTDGATQSTQVASNIASPLTSGKIRHLPAFQESQTHAAS